MPKPSNVVVRDPTADKNFDSSAKVLDPQGHVVREPGKVRKELVEDFLLLLQSTLNDKVSGIGYGNTVDMVENKLSEIRAYAQSLKEAVLTIETNFPSNEKDIPLSEMADLCDILSEGTDNVEQYLSMAKAFAEDLDRIKAEFNNQITVLFQEV